VAKAIVVWKQTLFALPTSHLSHLYAAQLLDFRNRFKVTGEPIKLLTAMLLSRKAMATDSRDKIFALLGLKVDGPNLVPALSYKNSLSDILVGLTRAMMIAQRSLDLICIRSIYPLEDHTMPSGTALV
jgi:hypothetical protein